MMTKRGRAAVKEKPIKKSPQKLNRISGCESTMEKARSQ